MLRTIPRTVINFQPNYETITRLFRDYDTLQTKYQTNPDLPPEELAPLRYAQLTDDITTYPTLELSTLISLLQIPHLDIEQEVRSRLQANGVTELSAQDWQKLQERITVARKWLENYADPEEKLIIYWDAIPDSARALTPEQRHYLGVLGDRLSTCPWDGETLQNLLFAVSRELNIGQKEAFSAIYLGFLGKERGPKAGHLFSYLDRQFVLKRLCKLASDPTA